LASQRWTGKGGLLDVGKGGKNKKNDLSLREVVNETGRKGGGRGSGERAKAWVNHGVFGLTCKMKNRKILVGRHKGKKPKRDLYFRWRKGPLS